MLRGFRRFEVVNENLRKRGEEKPRIHLSWLLWKTRRAKMNLTQTSTLNNTAEVQATAPNSRQWAEFYLANGLNVLPVRNDGSKSPALSQWEHLKNQRYSIGEMHRFTNQTGTGIICGAISNNLEIIDIETETAANEYFALLVDHGFGEVLNQTFINKTPSGGRHIYLRCTEPVSGNLKLAKALVPCDSTDTGARKFGTKWCKIKTLIETRGEGGYAVAPGSPPECHATGHLYEIFNGGPGTIATVTPDQLHAFHELARALNEYVEPEREVKPRAGKGDGARPGDDFNQRGDLDTFLKKHNWQRRGERNGKVYWQRPGKQGPGISATFNYADSGLFYVFSSNATPFESEHAYSPFAVVTLLEYNGNFERAARDLGRQGFGTPLDKKGHLKSATVGSTGPFTTTNAVAQNSTDTLTPPEKTRRFCFSPLAKILTLPDPIFLVHRLLTVGGTSLLTAKHASFKSFIALDISLSVATGRLWHGYEVRRGPVLYIAAEGISGIKKRAAAWLAHHNTTTPDNFHVLDIPFQIADAAARRAGCALNIAAENDSLPQLIGLVNGGLGCTVLPLVGIAGQTRLASRPIEGEDVTWRSSIVLSRRMAHDARAAALCQLVGAIISELVDTGAWPGAEADDRSGWPLPPGGTRR